MYQIILKGDDNMYSDTVKAENKIITKEDLIEIFQLMGETLKKYQKISMLEEQQNQMLDYNYKHYTFKDNGSKMRVHINFYDNTEISFDNYDNFSSIFYSRTEEIKSMTVRYSLSYEIVTPVPNKSRKYYTQSINMYITDSKIDIDIKLDSSDPKLNDIYELIKSKILNAPIKYDEIIKNKRKITNIVSISNGLIPSIIVGSIFLFIPRLNTFFLKGYLTYPILCIILSYVIGNIMASLKLDKYYAPIMPEKKYAGYDYNKRTSIYKDDIDKFVDTSEILIGKKVNNLTNRQIIKEQYEKDKKHLPDKLVILGIISIIVIVIGIFI